MKCLPSASGQYSEGALQLFVIATNHWHRVLGTFHRRPKAFEVTPIRFVIVGHVILSGLEAAAVGT